MEHGVVFIVLGCLAAFFMAFNNGANDIANAFASAVGSRAITMRTAIFIGGAVTFLGALLLGGNVAVKLVSGLVPPSTFGNAEEYVIAMITVLLASGTFVLISTLTSLPVSSSHAIVGSLTGISVMISGWETIQWNVIAQIALAWIVSPLIAAFLAFLLSVFIEGFVVGKSEKGVVKRVKFWLPIVIAVTVVGGIFALATLTSLKSSLGIDADQFFSGKTVDERIERQKSRAHKLQYETTKIRILADKIDSELDRDGMKNQDKMLEQSREIKKVSGELGVAADNLTVEFLGKSPAFFYAERWHVLIICLVLLIPVYFQCRWFIHKWLAHCEDTPTGVQHAFRNLQIGTSCYVAFAIGSNDVANSISPVLAICLVVAANGIPDTFDASMPLWILVLGGVAMATGITLLGNRVMKTLGEGITKINNARGFCIDFAVATSVVGASALGMPVSTTHAATGAVTGSGLSQDGVKSIQLSVLGRIVVGWIVTIPISLIITFVYFKIMKAIFM